MYLPVDDSADKDTTEGSDVKTEEKITQQIEEEQIETEQVIQQVCFLSKYALIGKMCLCV